MPTGDASTLKYAGGNVVMDRENCGWDRHVGQTAFSIFVVMAQQFLVGQGLIIEASRSHTTLGRTPLDE
jgi:hypothetical protein